MTDDAVAARADFLDRAVEVMEAGGASLAFHLRAPAASGRTVHDLAIRLIEVARSTGTLFLVNDRIDVALAVGADGVQLGRRSLTVFDARFLVGDEMRVGASVHAEEEARLAKDVGADFVVAGAVYATASHPGREPAGVALVERIAAAGAPVVAIGGVTPERAGDLKRAGAAGVAAIRGVWDAARPGDAVRRYLDAWRS